MEKGRWIDGPCTYRAEAKRIRGKMRVDRGRRSRSEPREWINSVLRDGEERISIEDRELTSNVRCQNTEAVSLPPPDLHQIQKMIVLNALHRNRLQMGTSNRHGCTSDQHHYSFSSATGFRG